MDKIGHPFHWYLLRSSFVGPWAGHCQGVSREQPVLKELMFLWAGDISNTLSPRKMINTLGNSQQEETANATDLCPGDQRGSLHRGGKVNRD